MGDGLNSPLSVKVAQVDALLLPTVDTGHGTGDLPGDESGTTARALMVEEDAVCQVHAVRLFILIETHSTTSKPHHFV